VLQPGALAEQLLGRVGVVPEAFALRLVVQTVELTA
jgi:hypothetical protein